MTAPALKVIDGGVPETVPFAKYQQMVAAVEQLSEENALLRKDRMKAERMNASLRTQLDRLKEDKALEEVGEDAAMIRALVRFHYQRVGRQKKTVPLSGMDAQIVIWLLRRAEMTARQIAIASVGFAANEFYCEKGLVSLMNMATSKVDGKRIRDEEKCWRHYHAGLRLRGGQV